MPSGTISPLLKQASGVAVTHGRGCHVFGADGRTYLDFTSGIGVTSTGHCHPRVVEAVREQAGKLLHGQYTTVLHAGLVELSDRLGALMPGDIDAFFYASAGTEAVEAAVRLCRQATGRPNIVVFHGGFHGRTAGSLAMTTSKVGLRAGLQPLMGGVVVAPFPDTYWYGWDEAQTTAWCLREVDRIFDTISAPEETAAMFIEPIQGEGGFVPANAGFFAGLRQRCDAHGMLLVVDEIQSGIGRTGRFWGHEHYGGAPDIVITAKGLASGMPLSAFGAPRALMERGWPGSQGGTYGGNAVACAAALATLDVIEDEGLVDNAAARGAELRQGLEALAKQHPSIGDVRGEGLMLGVEVVDASGAPDGERAAKLTRALEERGVLLLRCGPHAQVVRWLPPLVVSADQIQQALTAFAESLRATA